MSGVTDYEFVIGHIGKDYESMINNAAVTNGQVIFSEKSGLQFIDYADKRHTYGSVLTGVYNDTAYVDFSTLPLSDSLDAIIANELVVDGQIIKVDNLIYKYRKIGDNNFIVKTDESNVNVEATKTGYIIYFPEFTTGDLISMDLLVSITNEVNTSKLFLVKVVDNDIDLTACQDFDGTFDESTFDLIITHNGDGIFALSTVFDGTLKVVSYSATSTGSNKNEGLYVAASDL